MKRDDASRPGRAFLAAWIVWMMLGLLQAALTIGLGSGDESWLTVLCLHAIHATAWALITLGVRRLSATLASRPRYVWLSGHLAGLVIAGLIDSIVRRQATELLVGDVTIAFARTMLYYADVTTLSYILSTWLGKVIDAREALILQTRRELALRSQLARARLAYLHAQLQPHFLFNALGTVSELVFESPSAAVRTFRQLRAVLEAAASRNSEEIPLRDEVSGLMPYLEVQRTRFSDWLNIEIDIDPDAEDVLVPPLIFQPLVENSIRHGLRGRSSRGEIRIAATRGGKTLVLSVRDNGEGLPPGDGVRRRGVGLRNTEERIRTLYADAGSLKLYKDSLGGTVAEVALPAREEAPAVVPSVDRLLSRESEDNRPGFAERHPWMAVAGGGLIAAALWTQQSYAYLAMTGRLRDRTIFDLMRGDFFLVAMWTAMVPMVAWLSRRFPLTGKTWLRSIAAHIVAVSSLAYLHSTGVVLFRSGAMTGVLSTMAGTVAITLLLYLGVLAYTQRGMLRKWLSERQTAAARIEAEIADAEVAAATMSVDPESLAFVLSELEQFAEREPLRAEQAIARLGSDLRATLDESAGPRADRTSGSAGALRGEDRVERFAMGT